MVSADNLIAASAVLVSGASDCAGNVPLDDRVIVGVFACVFGGLFWLPLVMMMFGVRHSPPCACFMSLAQLIRLYRGLAARGRGSVLRRMGHPFGDCCSGAPWKYVRCQVLCED